MRKILSYGPIGCLLLILGCLLPQNCLSADVSNTNTGNSMSYAAHGIIVAILPDQKQITIHHQKIPGYMMEMTMDFSVKEIAELKGLMPGDEITFNLIVDGEQAWIEKLICTKQGAASVGKTVAIPPGPNERALLKLGDTLPDGELVTENGRHVNLSDYRGKILVFTFFFTRCPLPTYCPLMNRNFEAARALLMANSQAPTNWQFISISFDPLFDQPEILSSYGNSYREGNTDRWLFAASTPSIFADLAPRLGLILVKQNNSISHNLRTVVVDAKGRIFRQFNDNLWTPQQLVDAILGASSGAKELSPSTK